MARTLLVNEWSACSSVLKYYVNRNFVNRQEVLLFAISKKLKKGLLYFRKVTSLLIKLWFILFPMLHQLCCHSSVAHILEPTNVCPFHGVPSQQAAVAGVGIPGTLSLAQKASSHEET